MKANISGVFAILLLSVGAAQAQTVGDAIKAARDKEHDADWAGAINIYDQIIQQFPKEFPEVYAARASDRSLVDDNKGAVADYTKALELDKDPKDPILNHAHILGERAQSKDDIGDEKGALADYRLAVKDDPTDPFMIGDLADVELNTGACAAANTDYSQAIALVKDPLVLYFNNRAIARLCLGDIANSYSDYQAAVALDLKETPSPPLFGGLYLDAWAVGVKLGRKDDADKALTDQLAATKQEDDSLDRDIAAYYLGKIDAAAVTKRAADYAKGNPNDSWISYGIYYIGLKQMADGENKAAIASFQDMLGRKYHMINTPLEARSWIKLLGGGAPAPAKSAAAAPAKKK